MLTVDLMRCLEFTIGGAELGDLVHGAWCMVHGAAGEVDRIYALSFLASLIITFELT